MNMTGESSFLAGKHHYPIDVVHSWIALGCPENIAGFRFMLGQPYHHIVAKRDFPRPSTLRQDKPHHVAIKVDIFPFQQGCLAKSCSRHQHEVRHRSKRRLNVSEKFRYFPRSEVINHAVSRPGHEFYASQRVPRYPLLLHCAVEHASERANLKMNRPLRNALTRALLVGVLPSAVYIVADVIWLQLVNMLDRQFLENSRQCEVCSEGVFLAAVGQKPLDVPVGKLRQQRTSAISVLDTEVEVSLDLLLDLSALVLGLCLCGYTYFFATMPKSGIPDDVSIGFLSFPRHTIIQTRHSDSVKLFVGYLDTNWVHKTVSGFGEEGDDRRNLRGMRAKEKCAQQESNLQPTDS